MRKVYIVTEGEYSDYRIIAAHETRASAELWVEMHRKYVTSGGAEIEEWDLHGNDPEKWPTIGVDGSAWRTVVLDYDTGEFLDFTEKIYSLEEKPSKDRVVQAWWEGGELCRQFSTSVWCRADERERAVKIAGERRLMRRAETSPKEEE